MYNLQLQDKLRASDVKRWHIVRTKRPQSLAEHQYNVAMIVVAMTPPVMLHPALIMAALQHDLDEVVEGDIPSNAKHRANIGDALNFWTEDLSRDEKRLIKMADLIEAWWWIKSNGDGRHAEHVVCFCFEAMEHYMNDNFKGTSLYTTITQIIHQLNSGGFII